MHNQIKHIYDSMHPVVKFLKKDYTAPLADPAHKRQIIAVRYSQLCLLTRFNQSVNSAYAAG
jgi:hypothetical protein